MRILIALPFIFSIVLVSGQSNWIDPEPTFPGGNDSLMRFISSNLKYPESAYNHHEQGKVIVKLVIGENGKVLGANVVKGVSTTLDAEAMRVVKMLPAFIPDKRNVSESYLLPINFKINQDIKLNSDSAQRKITTASIFSVVEKMPEFPGGEERLLKFIQTNLKYPDTEPDMHGRVVIGFVINEDGSLSDIIVKKSLSPPYDAEALRIVGMLPKFIPGMQQGKKVKVSYVLPIMFGLPEDKRRDQRRK